MEMILEKSTMKYFAAVPKRLIRVLISLKSDTHELNLVESRLLIVNSLSITSCLNNMH